MIIAYILLGLATIFMFEIFQGLRDLDVAQAHLIHYVNISSPAPQVPNDTLTNSIRKRVSELYGTPVSGLDVSNIDTVSQFDSKTARFYQVYMQVHMHKLSNALLFADEGSSLRLFALNSRWVDSTPHTDLALYSLKEERLYKKNPEGFGNRAWKHCFYHELDGFLEAMTDNENIEVAAASLYDLEENSRYLLYFNKLKYSYSNSMSTYDFYQLYFKDAQRSNGIDSKIDYKKKPQKGLTVEDQEEDLDDSVMDFDVYDTIPIEEDSKIENIATTDGIIVYITLEEPMKLKCLFKTGNDTWEKKTIEYPTAKASKFTIYKHLGMNFIHNSVKGERQLLMVDLLGGEAEAKLESDLIPKSELKLVYHICQFADGQSILYDETPRVTYGLKPEEEVESRKIYGTKMFELFTMNITRELGVIDVLQNMPRSIIKSHAGTEQTVIVSLGKYVSLITKGFQPGSISKYDIKQFEDQHYKIKSVDISNNGKYFTFLTHSKDLMKIFVLQSKPEQNSFENKLYFIAFDYSMDMDYHSVKKAKLIENKIDESVLVLLLENGEVASFSLEFGVMSWENIRGSKMTDEFDFLSISSIVIIIFMYVVFKIASSTRIHINFHRPR